MAQCYSIARGDRRVRRVAIEGSATACREQCCRRPYLDQAARLDVEDPGAETALIRPGGIRHQVEDHVILQYSNSGMSADGTVECFFDGRSRVIAAMYDARARVTALDTERQRPARF
jgi:hypothetical protein